MNLADSSTTQSDTEETIPNILLAQTSRTALSKIFDGTNSQFLLNFEIHLQSGMEQIQVLFAETKALLSYIQQVDPKAKFMPKVQ